MIGFVAYVLALLLRAPEQHARARAEAERERDRLQARLNHAEMALDAARPLIAQAECYALEDRRIGAGMFWNRCRAWNVAHGNPQRNIGA